MTFFKSTLNSILFALSLIGFSQKSFGEHPHFDIQGQLNLPNSINYRIKITHLPQGFHSQFKLNPGLKIQLTNNDTLLRKENNEFEYFDNGDRTFEAEISGELQNRTEEDPLYSENEIILTGNSNWIPFLFPTQTLKLQITTRPGTMVFNPSEISKSCGNGCFEFEETRPQEDIYLVLGRFSEYKKKTPGGINVGVLLINDDPALAQSYLDLLPEYIERYSHIIGPYPYNTFYVIENFNETGFGMPGFTLLGASVIRLPFILKSSLPHEVLHNWWGNGVFVDYSKGNWCEGLTTYMADHYEQSLLNLDTNYRRNTLVTYLDYVTQENEFPLIEFQGRHNESSQAIGYGKTMMFFHMLKNWIGENQFNLGIQQSYRENQFKSVGFLEFLKSFQVNETQSLSAFINPWVLEKGAVTIQANSLCVNQQWHIKVESSPKSFQFILPYQTTENQNSKTERIKIENGFGDITLAKGFSGMISLDPSFEVFRTLSSGEKPITLSRVFSAETLYVLLDQNLNSQFQSWLTGIKTLFQGKIIFINSNEIGTLPKGSQVIFFTVHLPEFPEFEARIKEIGISFIANQLTYKNTSYETRTHSWVVMAETHNRSLNLTWVKPNLNYDQMLWGKQLTHYSQQGLLVYLDKKNILKESLAAGKSDLEFNLGECKK